jgi:DNA-binding LytR/AlgR family response regulator
MISLDERSRAMIIKKTKDQHLPKDMIEIKYNPDDDQALKLINQIESSQGHLIGYHEETIYPILFNDLYYAESIDDKVILYTKNDSFTSSYRLYQLEEMDDHFIRIHKSMVVNIKKIKAFRSTINAKLEAQLDNHERIEINRTYVKALKERMHQK